MGQGCIPKVWGSAGLSPLLRRKCHKNWDAPILPSLMRAIQCGMKAGVCFEMQSPNMCSKWQTDTRAASVRVSLHGEVVAGEKMWWEEEVLGTTVGLSWPAVGRDGAAGDWLISLIWTSLVLPHPLYHEVWNVILLPLRDNLVSVKRGCFQTMSLSRRQFWLLPPWELGCLRDAGWRNTQPGSLIASGPWLTVTARGFSGYSLLIEMTLEEQTLPLLRHLFWAKGNLSFIVSSSKWDDISSVGGQMYWKPVKIHSIFRDADMFELEMLL